ncbi:MAG: DUF4859 domain-containing protein [Prevotella sp.]|nr:DUF4859 domain-containing protein [Prevotella sp.]
MKRLLAIIVLLFSLTTNLLAQKSLYTPEEWKNYNEAETLLYKKSDAANQYTWSESRSKQSDNCIVYWDKGYGSTAPNELDSSNEYYVDIDDLLAKAEAFYELESLKLGFVDPQNSNIAKYKIMILLNHSTDWICYGGGYDFQISALWLSPSTCHPVGHSVAHEVGHSFHYMCYAEDSNHGSNSSIQTGFHSAVGNGSVTWEQTAQWQANQSYPEEMFNQSINIFRNSHNYAFTHEWHRYQSYWFFYYLCQYYNDIQTIANVWNYRETTVKDFNQVLMDLKGLSVQELFQLYFDYALRCATWDFDACENYRDNYIGDFNYNYVKLGASKYQVAYASAPQSTGFNVIPLNVPTAGTTITTHFTALAPGCSLASGDPAQYLNGESTYTSAGTSSYNSVSAASARGFRAGYVALLKDGTRQYFNDNTLHCTGTGEKTEDISMTVPKNTSKIYLVVAPAPTQYFQHQWDESIKDDDQWPYQVEFVGTNLGGQATLDGREISNITLTYDVSLKPAADYSSATVRVESSALAMLCTAFQLNWSDIVNRITSYSTSGPSNSQIMFYAANADGSLIESGSTANGYGHWFNASGEVTTWGSNSYVYSEFTTSTPTFAVGQMPNMNISGDQRTIRQALRYKDTMGKEAIAYFVFNITFDDNATNSASLSNIEYGEAWLLGDVNMDHEVTIADVTALVNILLGKSSDYKLVLADVNEDGELSIADVTALVNVLLGKAEQKTVYLVE